MEEEINIIGGGLTPLPKDKRDLKFGQVFSLPALEELPKGYKVGDPIVIRDQGSDDTCTSRSSNAVSEDQELVLLCDYFTFAIIKLIEGNPFSWGADLRSTAKAHQKYGALEQEDCPLCKNSSHDLQRDRDWNNWPDKETLLELASKHKKASYFSV